MFATAKGAVLIKNTVPIRHIVKITLLGCPKYMLWRQPQVLVPLQRCARCQLCGKEYKNGTLWCYDGCWMPLTWLAVQERIQHIATKKDRESELWSCYGLDHKGLSELQKAVGVSTRNLPLNTFSALYQRRHCEHFELAPPGRRESEKGEKFLRNLRRQGTGSQPVVPAMAAVRAPESSGPAATALESSRPSSLGSTGQQAASSSSASAGTGANAVPLPRVQPRGSVAAVAALPPLEGCSRASRNYRLELMLEMGSIQTRQIYNLNKNARAKRASDGTRFLSHTDRWERCDNYREQKILDGCPKWLIYESGDTHRRDNEKGDQFPEEGGWW
jgi:hypothetical protein